MESSREVLKSSFKSVENEYTIVRSVVGNTLEISAPGEPVRLLEPILDVTCINSNVSEHLPTDLPDESSFKLKEFCDEDQHIPLCAPSIGITKLQVSMWEGRKRQRELETSSVPKCSVATVSKPVENHVSDSTFLDIHMKVLSPADDEARKTKLSELVDAPKPRQKPQTRPESEAFLKMCCEYGGKTFTDFGKKILKTHDIKQKIPKECKSKK